MPSDSTQGWWIGIGGVATAVLTAVGSIYALFRDKKKSDFEVTVKALKDHNEALSKELKETKDEFHAFRGECGTKINLLHAEIMKCHAEKADMNATIKILQADIEDLKETNRGRS